MSVTYNAIAYSARVGESDQPWTLPVVQVQGWLNPAIYTEAQLEAAALAFLQALAGAEPLSDGHKAYPDITSVDEWSF